MKRIFFTSLQIGITAFLLWWIFRDPAKRTQMVEALKTADYLWLIPGVVSLGCAFLLQTERWRRLLSVQEINLGLVENLSRLFDRRLLQSLPSRRHGWRYREDLLCDAGDRF